MSQSIIRPMNPLAPIVGSPDRRFPRYGMVWYGMGPRFFMSVTQTVSHKVSQSVRQSLTKSVSHSINESERKRERESERDKRRERE